MSHKREGRILRMPVPSEPEIEDLIEVYRMPDDLITVFPEVVRGDMRRLIRWAITCGATIDRAKQVLERHVVVYRKILASYRDILLDRARLELKRCLKGIGVEIGPLNNQDCQDKNRARMVPDTCCVWS